MVKQRILECPDAIIPKGLWYILVDCLKGLDSFILISWLLQGAVVKREDFCGFKYYIIDIQIKRLIIKCKNVSLNYKFSIRGKI